MGVLQDEGRKEKRKNLYNKKTKTRNLNSDETKQTFSFLSKLNRRLSSIKRFLIFGSPFKKRKEEKRRRGEEEEREEKKRKEKEG